MRLPTRRDVGEALFCGSLAAVYDALIGGIALPGSVVFFVFLRWPRNTITYTLRSGTVVTSTMNSFQHDEAVGWTLAALLPVTNELRRRNRRRHHSVAR
jgi:hypothetical protein